MRHGCGDRAVTALRVSRNPKWLVACGLGSVTLASVLACRAEVGSQISARLSVDEVVSFRPPPTFAPSGAYVAENGASITWSRGDRRILLADKSGKLNVLTNSGLESPIGVAFGRTSEQIEVVDGGDAPRIVRLSSRGELVRVTRIHARVRASQAVRTERGDWYLLGADSAAKLVISFAAAPEFTVQVLELPPEIPSQVFAEGVRLQVDGETALIVGPVVSGCAVRAEGREARTTLALGSTIGSCRAQKFTASDVTSPRLVHLSTLPLGPGRYLQTLADPRTDVRTLRVISQTGLVERTTTIGAPIAMLSSSGAGWLVGIREPRNTEVVLYRWSWRVH